MKWIKIIIPGIFILAIVFILAVTGHDKPTIPRFVPGAPASVGAFTWDHYNWNTPAPFEGGKVWMWTAGPGITNSHTWLFDLEQRKILGELRAGGCPELWCPTNSRILCQGPDTASVTWKRKLFEFIARITGHKTWAGGRRTESFWILDIHSNVATRLGSVEQFAGSGSSWNSAPGFRYGYTIPSTMMGQSCVLCDLEGKTFEKVSVGGSLKGWWDDHTLLVAAGGNTFELFDVLTRKTRPLFSAAEVGKFLSTAGITNSTGDLDAIANWNGRGYDFYFGPQHMRAGGADIALLKLERDGPSLKLLNRHFMTQWGGRLDADTTHYLYQGESGAPGRGGNGAVYLRNLTNDSVVTIVPPDNSKQYAIPRFYGNEVIYFRNRILHRIGLDGANDAPLLSPAGIK